MTEAFIGLPAADTVAQRIRTQQVVQGSTLVDQEVHTLAAPDGTLLDPATLAQQATLTTVLARLTSILAQLQTTLTVSGAVTVSDGSGPLTVDGTVAVSGTAAITAAALPLPAGASTSAKQDSLQTALTDGSQKTQVTSSALPTGAATSAKQDALLTATIDGSARTQDTVAIGGPTTVATTAQTAIATPTAGKRLRVKWIYLSTPETNTAPTVVTVRLGATAIYTVPLGTPGIFAHRAVREGATDAALTVTSTTTQTVYANVDYEEY